MAAGTGADELRLTWSARGLAYLLRKHGIEKPPLGMSLRPRCRRAKSPSACLEEDCRA
jgi:hypothetical protein